jgi:lariat debranching enzyme
MQIAVEGCCHGELDKIYETLQALEQRTGRPIHLLICCGDFQAVRNLDDLECMACPPKYRHLGTFWKYYAGIKVAPYPTLFSK